MTARKNERARRVGPRKHAAGIAAAALVIQAHAHAVQGGPTGWDEIGADSNNTALIDALTRPIDCTLKSQQQIRSIGMVMGCGSNVVDEFYPLRRFPKVRMCVRRACCIGWVRRSVVN